MPDIRRALKSDRIMKSLSGLTGSEFLRPVPAYKEQLTASALEKNEWVQTKAALSLGISERVLRYKMGKYMIKAK